MSTKSIALLGFWLVACGEPEASSPNQPSGQQVEILDVHNYTSHTDLTIPTVMTQAGVDLQVCWDKVTVDVRDRTITPADVNYVLFLRDSLSHAEIEPQLELGNFDSAQADVYYSLYAVKFPAETATTHCLPMSALRQSGADTGAPWDPAVENTEMATGTYLLTLNQGNYIGAGALSLMYITPVASGGVTQIDFPANSNANVLNFTAAFSATPLAIPSAGPWTVSWAGITKDSQGITPPGVNKLQLAFFQDKTADVVGQDILHLERNATQLWEKTLGGAKFTTLGEAVERTTQMPFSATGFNNGLTGTWVLALSSTRSQNPAPVVMTVLQPM